LKLERSIDNLASRLERFDPVFHSSNKTDLSYWKGKPIIPLDEWIKFRDTSYALDYFPDDFDRLLTCIPEDGLKEQKREDVWKWDSDFLELMEYTRNPNYGRLRCFHCLLSPDGDDPIFIGINRLVAKGLDNGEQENGPIEYPCRVVNRFQCPYERTNVKEDNEVESTNSHFYVEDLFRLQKMAFIVEIVLATARKEDSEIQIKDKQDVLHVLSDKDTFIKLLKQANDTLNSSEYREVFAGQNIDSIVNYFMGIKEMIDLNELRLY
jgi:hypothetical protein